MMGLLTDHQLILSVIALQNTQVKYIDDAVVIEVAGAIRLVDVAE